MSDFSSYKRKRKELKLSHLPAHTVSPQNSLANQKSSLLFACENERDPSPSFGGTD